MVEGTSGRILEGAGSNRYRGSLAAAPVGQLITVVARNGLDMQDLSDRTSFYFDDQLRGIEYRYPTANMKTSPPIPALLSSQYQPLTIGQTVDTTLQPVLVPISSKATFCHGRWRHI